MMQVVAFSTFATGQRPCVAPVSLSTECCRGRFSICLFQFGREADAECEPGFPDQGIPPGSLFHLTAAGDGVW